MNDAPDLVALFKTLAHEGRIRVVAAIITRPRSIDGISAELGMTRRDVAEHLGMLAHFGLAVPQEVDGITLYSFSRQPLVEVLKGLSEKGRAPDIGDDVDDFDRRVLTTFLVDGTLTSIPAQQKKRDAVLRFLAERFEPERMYDEREVNAVLREYHPDVASLRRYLVDGGFLQRQVIRSVPVDTLGSENPPVEPRVQYWKPRAAQ
jgi:DNA-binding transcriptional ArsR family regulator